jgi:hypothetical protein
LRRVAIARWSRLRVLGFKQLHLFSQILLLSPTPLPAVPPIQYQELKAEGVDLDCRLETNAKVVVVHLIELRA